jgi:DnaK suppressor protein
MTKATKAAPESQTTGQPPLKTPPAGKTPPSRKAAAAKPAPAKVAAGPAADRFLAEQRAELVAERASYVEQAESLLMDAEQLAQDMEPGDIQFDEESGEGDTLNVERERDLVLSAQARAAVDEIDRALAKMDAGTYGVCERCGNPIPKARLKALPYASLCVACKSGGLSRR